MDDAIFCLRALVLFTGFGDNKTNQISSVWTGSVKFWSWLIQKKYFYDFQMCKNTPNTTQDADQI